MRMISIPLVLLVAVYVRPVSAEYRIAQSTKLTEDNYLEVRYAVLDRPAKEQWAAIPWRPSLAEAIEEARKNDKPILLWIMNGHPCGMT